jgi:hypothetical protein
MSDAIVLHASLPAAPRAPWQESLLQSLPYARRLQLADEVSSARFASLAGLALVLLGAERLVGRPFAPRDFNFPLDQKPALERGPGFSVSHSTGRVACCVMSSTGCGIDIEDPPDDADADTLIRLRRWTATEAVLKAMGLGLRAVREVSLDAAIEAGSVRGERFELQPLDAVPGMIGHLASRTRCALVLAAVDLDGPELSTALERSLGVPLQFE